MRKWSLLLALLWLNSGFALAAPAGWSAKQSKEILDQTRELWLAPELDDLSPGERLAIDKLVAAGRILQQVYERQVHPDSALAKARLDALPDDPQTLQLRALYRLSNGPVAVTLDNQRLPFLPVAPLSPSKGVYPSGVTREQVEAFLETHPEQRTSLLDSRSVLRRADTDSALLDHATLEANPVLDVLHPGLRDRLAALVKQPEPQAFYALPYSVAFADELLAVYGLLNEAAAAVQSTDAEFAGYLRNRARDLLSDDYESGDASWVSGQFGNLNAQIGSFETYDDELYGVRTFFSLSVLRKRVDQTARLREALGNLQVIEDSLPYESDRQVRSAIPIGAYDVIADFGQARGGNTASILPNDPLHAARYGRVILLRANIMQHPVNADVAQTIWKQVLQPEHANDLGPDGSLQRTLWHEIGHYLGVDRTRDGRPLDEALQENANLIEELKADLVALHAAAVLHRSGYYDDAGLRAVYASGILRVLQRVQPRRDQAYGAMQLMQWNWFLEHGLLSFDAKHKRLRVDYSKYPVVIETMLKAVLALQAGGDSEATAEFIGKYFRWDPKLHEVIATSIRGVLKFRFSSYRYEVLDGEAPAP